LQTCIRYCRLATISLASRKGLVVARCFTRFEVLLVDLLLQAALWISCAIELCKTVDKVNHYALYGKFMKRHIPLELLELLNNMFPIVTLALSGLMHGRLYSVLIVVWDQLWCCDIFRSQFILMIVVICVMEGMAGILCYMLTTFCWYHPPFLI